MSDRSPAARNGDGNAGYDRALDGAALFDVSERGKVELKGADAVLFLHNLCTNDIKNLAEWSGCEAFLTTAQARVVAPILVYRMRGASGEILWLDADPGLGDKVVKHLDHHLISERVELADRTREDSQFHVAGPGAQTIVDKVMTSPLGDLAELGHAVRQYDGANPCHVRRHSPLGVPGFDLVCPAVAADDLRNHLVQAGADSAGPEAYEVLRVEAGTPLFGVDIDDNRLVMEVARPSAICFTKGCFLGQEPIVMARDRGHVNRAFLGVKLEGSPAPRGTKLFHEGKEVGEITSSVFSPRLEQAIALAYIRRGHQEPGTVLECGEERRRAEVSALPFVRGRET